MSSPRPPYLVAGGAQRRQLQEKVAILWEFGYRPHGSMVVTRGGDNWTLCQPMTYNAGHDGRRGEDIPLEVL